MKSRVTFLSVGKVIRRDPFDGLPAAAALYRRYGFRLTEEKPSTAFGRPLREQRYDLVVSSAGG